MTHEPKLKALGCFESHHGEPRSAKRNGQTPSHFHKRFSNCQTPVAFFSTETFESIAVAA